ncbi:hypothetical protein [Parvicella tangerina]|uniref:NACHT domain-containing protein n=1 Tax=Parvicella tangerina TaxID=2829795 RepID=A0A916JNK1_9FLAO|nr:hypothetical protein [Parvicella tangerina]CAG5082956.1 hypothetical protein CRYO30217_02053 [Parvicella tangerina]
MSLTDAHKGYEFQDLLCSYFILDEVLKGNNCQFQIDTKLFSEDRFDDLTIFSGNGVYRKQIKYSDNISDKELSKNDLSSDNYGLAIDALYNSYKSETSNELRELRICLGWNKPTDELTNILQRESTSPESFKTHKTELYKINVDKLWPEETGPIDKWKRFKKASSEIDRNEFIKFCNLLIIEVNLPKSSIDIYNPGELESIVLEQMDRLGIGMFPNEQLSPASSILDLTHKIKLLRANNGSITEVEILDYLRINRDYGSINQKIPVDKEKNIIHESHTKSIIKRIFENRKSKILAEPGAGKSWFISNIEEQLNEQKIPVIRHFCYTDLEDELQTERITLNRFYGNLVSEILEEFPFLKNVKQRLFSSNLEELNLLLKEVPIPTILIIDGLDHIDRIYGLYGHGISPDEVKIIEKISELELGDNVSVVLSSQPISSVKALDEYKDLSLPEWKQNDVKDLANRFGLSVTNTTEDIVDLLFKKSEGNALYLTYLIKEVAKMPQVSSETIQKLPTHSNNLNDYYEYLLSKLNEDKQVPYILAGCSFRVTTNELKEITGIGNYVIEQLEDISSVIKTNISRGGHLIYHESFRRFLIEKLKEKDVDVSKTIYTPIINWFENNDFFKSSKTFRFYLPLLSLAGRFDLIINKITITFITDSLYYGHSLQSIQKNCDLFLKAIFKTQDFPKLIIHGELRRVLESTENEYYESFISYFEALGHVHGFDSACDFLSFEGVPTLDESLGISACFLIESNGTPAPWHLYDEYFSNYEFEDFSLNDWKYYVLYLCNLKELEDIGKIVEYLFEIGYWELIKEIKNSVLKTSDKEFIKQTIPFFEEKKPAPTKIQENQSLVYTTAIELTSKLLELEHVFEKEQLVFQKFESEISKLIQCDDDQTINEIIGLLEYNNWFYNWVIYSIRLKQLCKKENVQSSEIVTLFEILNLDTEPFKGTPRTIDLYQLHETILKSIDQGLELIDELPLWEKVTTILLEVADSITTSLQNDPGGPLTASKLLRLLDKHKTENNLELFSRINKTIINDKESYYLHHYVSEFYFQLSKFQSLRNEIENSQSFRTGIEFMIGYTHRKDSTIEELLNGVNGVLNVDREAAHQWILKLKPLVDSVVNHTDGKGTKHFPVRWFKDYLSIAPSEAILYLLNNLKYPKIDWRLEDNLRLGIIANEEKHLVNSFNSRTIPLDDDESFFKSRLRSCQELESLDKDSGRSLLISLCFSIQRKTDLRLSPELIDEFKKCCENYQINVPDELNSFSNYSKKKNRVKTVHDYIKEIAPSRKELSEMNSDEISEYFEKYNVTEREILSLKYYFESKGSFENDDKKIIIALLPKNKHYVEGESKELLTDWIFENNSEYSTFYWVARFVVDTGGWYERLINQDAFQRACSNNEEQSINFLFELLYKEFNGKYYTLRIASSNLLKALSRLQKYKCTALEMWQNLFDSINYRLPSVEEIDWTEELENSHNLDEDEILICILLSRLRSPALNKHLVVYEGIYQLFKFQPDKLIKPINWFFSNSKLFYETDVYVILELIRYFKEIEEAYPQHFKKSIEKLYPKRHFLIDFIIEELFPNLKGYRILFEESNFHTVDNEMYESYLELNIRHRLLEDIGYNLRGVFGKYYKSVGKLCNDDYKIMYNRSKDILAPAICGPDHLLSLINKQFYNSYFDGDYIHPNQLFISIRVRLELLLSQEKSLISRPNFQFPKDELGFKKKKEIQYASEDWVRIGSYEEQLILGYKREDFEKHIRYAGLTFEDSKENDFPFSSYRINPEHLWSPEKCDYEIESNIVCSFIQTHDTLENYRLLWLNPVLVRMLGLSGCKKFEHLQAVNEDGEVILKYNAWKSNPIGTGYSNGPEDELPTLKGAELLIRKDYFDKLCSFFDSKPLFSQLVI